MKYSNIVQYNHSIVKCYFILLLASCQFYLIQCAPHDVEAKLCPGTPTFTRRNDTYFISLGGRCSVENDAYVLGAIYDKFTTDGKKFDAESLQERWSSMAYLDASLYDKLGNPTPPPATPSCIFNERLAKQQSKFELDISVALSCNPFDLTYCRMEYDDSLSLTYYCDCNYLYSIKENTSTGEIKCLAKAGVPCKFKQTSNNDPLLNISESIKCHDSLICKPANQTERNRIFKKAFHGFGLNPIHFEYMLENAESFCDCRDKRLHINPLNECVYSKAIRWIPQICNAVFILLILYSIL